MWIPEGFHSTRNDSFSERPHKASVSVSQMYSRDITHKCNWDLALGQKVLSNFTIWNTQRSDSVFCCHLMQSEQKMLRFHVGTCLGTIRYRVYCIHEQGRSILISAEHLEIPPPSPGNCPISGLNLAKQIGSDPSSWAYWAHKAQLCAWGWVEIPEEGAGLARTVFGAELNALTLRCPLSVPSRWTFLPIDSPASQPRKVSFYTCQQIHWENGFQADLEQQ